METDSRTSRPSCVAALRCSRFLLPGVLAALLLLAISAPLAIASAGRVIPSPRPSAPDRTEGCLRCPDGTPLAGCTVTLEYWDSSGILTTKTVVTDATGCFNTTVLCSGSNQQNEHWVITSTCCPSTTWTIATNQCWGNLGTLVCDDCSGCTPPPSNMTGWWPLDELSPSTTADIASGNTCAWIGAPSPTPGQWVTNSTFLATASDYHSCPTPTTMVDFGTGNFTIDAWVRGTNTTTAVRTIVDHRQIVQGSTQLRGYALYISYGRLGIQMADGLASPGYNNWTSPGPNLWDGVWHHVAASVVRGSLTGGLLYVDGVLALTFDPTVRAGSLDNKGSFRIGQAYDNSSSAFAGGIDEVEIFRRALSPTEVQALSTAGSHGKCKEACYLLWDVGVWQNQATVTTNLTICNYGTSPATYTWSMAGLPVGPGCLVPGPTGFAPPAGTVTVPAGSCMNLPVTITNPGLTGNNVACYQATVTNTGSGHVFHCGGSLQGNPTQICVTRWKPFDVVALFASRQVCFTATNLGDTPVQFTYTIEAMPADMSPAERVIGLNGLPPGTPVLGSVDVSGQDSAVVIVDCLWGDHDPFVPHDIILAADLDGDGVPEPLESTMLFEENQTPVAIGDGPGRTPLAGLAVSPTPFRHQMSVRFSLDAPSDVRVEVWDVSGRLVRTLRSGAMPAGLQSVTWDGRLSDGRAATSGLYVVRVQAGSRVLSAKVLRAP